MYRQYILYVDYNHQKRARIGRNLEHLEFGLHRATTARIAREKIKQYHYPLVIMDFDSLGEEIFKLCSLVRMTSSNAVVIALMSRVKIKVEERLFDIGVDDVVVGKQISSRVLAKRIQAHFRKLRPFSSRSRVIRLKDTVVDFHRREVWCNGTVRPLPGILADLLKYFIERPNHIVSREELGKSRIWADSICTPANEGGKTFDVNMGKLRKIIEPDPANPEIIISVRGVGWKLETYCMQPINRQLEY